MEDILELILTILWMPFEGKYEDLFRKINKKPNKLTRIAIKIILIAIPVLLVVGLVALCSYLIRGYWI